MKYFNVYGRKYKLLKSKELPDGAQGFCDSEKRTITVADTLKGIDLIDTILHELIHAKDFETGLFQSMDRTMLEMNAVSVARVILDNFIVKMKK